MRLDFDEQLRRFAKTDYRRVVGAVAVVCGSAAVAEDSVQEALARAWEHRARGVAIDSLTGWVTVVALNHARSGLRRRRIEARVRVTQWTRADVSAGSDGIATRVDMARLVATLPRRPARSARASPLPGLGRSFHR